MKLGDTGQKGVCPSTLEKNSRVPFVVASLPATIQSRLLNPTMSPPWGMSAIAVNVPVGPDHVPPGASEVGGDRR